ncbi:MAG: polysaccharide deacetylase family protein [Chitinophagaceae bacterium]
MKRMLLLLLICPIGMLAQKTGWNLNPYFVNFLESHQDSVVKQFFYKAETKKKEVALTFDDGVIENTPNLVNYLKANNIPATFFLIMRSVNQENLHLFDAPQFELGIHSWKHDDFRNLTEAQKIADMDSCERRLKELRVIDRFPYYRPAYGVIDTTIAREIKRRNWKGVLWSAESQDWNGLKGDTLIKHTMKDLDRGSIILFHDIVSVQDLDAVCKAIREKGFRIVPLSKLIRRRPHYPRHL